MGIMESEGHEIIYDMKQQQKKAHTNEEVSFLRPSSIVQPR